MFLKQSEKYPLSTAGVKQGKPQPIIMQGHLFLNQSNPVTILPACCACIFIQGRSSQPSLFYQQITFYMKLILLVLKYKPNSVKIIVIIGAGETKRAQTCLLLGVFFLCTCRVYVCTIRGLDVCFQTGKGKYMTHYIAAVCEH